MAGMQTGAGAATRPAGVGGRIFGALLLALCLGIGIWQAWLCSVSARRVAHWATVPAVIESSSVDGTQGRYKPALRYRYTFQGQTHVASRLAFHDTGASDNYGTVQRLVDACPPGATVSCLVNPDAPDEAVLRNDILSRGTKIIALWLALSVLSGWWCVRLGRRRAPGAGNGGPFLVFFFGVFLLVGGGMFGGLFLRPWIGIQQARGWTETPCTIVSSEVQSHRGSKGGSTYNVAMLYRYAVDGREYKSNRYSFMSGSSNGKEGKSAVVRRFPAGARAVCYVDPHDVYQAVFERGITPDFLFGLFPLLFFFAGAAGITWWLTMGRLTPAPIIGAAADEPWLQRPEWATRRIVHSARPGERFAWTFTGILLLVALPTLWAFGPEALKPGRHIFAIGLILPLAGAVCAAFAVRATRRRLAFGDSVFELRTLPAAVGGALEGTLRLSRILQPAEGFLFRLTCIQRVTTSSGGKRETSESSIWQDERRVQAAAAIAVPVAFAIPADGCETGGAGADDRVFWRLDVSASADGLTYASRFEVPVFRVAQSAVQQAEALRVRAEEQTEAERGQLPERSRIRVEPAPGGGQSFYFPPCRNPGAAFFISFFLLIWSGAVWFMITQHAPLLFPIVFGAFELLLVWWAMNLWFGTTRVVAMPGSLTVTRGYCGLGRSRTVFAADVTEITTRKGMTSGTTVYTDIKIIRRQGNALTAGDSIQSVREAAWLAGAMARASGVRGPA